MMEKKREMANFRGRKIITAEQTVIKKQISRKQMTSQKQHNQDMQKQKFNSNSKNNLACEKVNHQNEQLQKEIDAFKLQQKENQEIIKMQEQMINQLQLKNSQMKKHLKDQKLQTRQLISMNPQLTQDPDMQLAIQLSATQVNNPQQQINEFYNPYRDFQPYIPQQEYLNNNPQNNQNFEQQYSYQMALEMQREEYQEMRQQMRKQMIQEHPELFNPDELSYEELLLLEEKMGNVSKGLNQSQIESIQNVKVSNLMIGVIVCQCELAQGEFAKQLKCKHFYHNDCITKWLQSKNTCPICLKLVQ